MKGIFILIIYFLSCQKNNMETYLDLIKKQDDSQYLNLLSLSKVSGEIVESGKLDLVWIFDKSLNINKCIESVGISPPIRGIFLAGINQFEFHSSDTEVNDGMYTITLNKSCEDIKGYNLKENQTIYLNFIKKKQEIVEKPIPSPAIVYARLQAIGLASQSCSEKYPGEGSPNGGDWNSKFCYWDDRYPILPSNKYLFRGGDSGNGSFGSQEGCIDVKTDNIRLIFDSYMDPIATLKYISFNRISPPSTNIKLGGLEWKDCSADQKCRVVDLAFSEQESSCNGNVFGNISTKGDFNLSSTIGSPNQFPIYILEISKDLKNSNGNSLDKTYTFLLEGK
jgi:hypothetical protein